MLVGRIYLGSNVAEAQAQRAVPMRQMQPSQAAQAKFVICNQTIEYGFKQAKDELGWADFRLTDAPSIERWWELVMCAYLFVSLQAPALARASSDPTASASPAAALQHPAWTDDASWTHRLNNLRLLLQPFACTCLLLRWLRLYPLPHLTAVLADLCALMNTYRPLYPT